MDTGGLLGPSYSFADELKTPTELNIREDGSFEGIMRGVGGINYYVDAIGFGEATMIARDQKMNQQPLGIRYFIKTGRTCDNGADMYEYVSTVPSGLPGRVGKEIESLLKVKFRGLGPGIVEDAVGALNPMPLFKSVTGSAYSKCKKVTKPVGDLNNHIQSQSNPKNVWVTDEYKNINGVPHQTRWVHDSYVEMDAYDAATKTEMPGVLPPTGDFPTEGFSNQRKSQVAAGILFAVLMLGLMGFARK
jgi:tetrahydromethanopterin S-methyltransferase subunit F